MAELARILSALSTHRRAASVEVYGVRINIRTQQNRRSRQQQQNNKQQQPDAAARQATDGPRDKRASEAPKAPRGGARRAAGRCGRVNKSDSLE